MQITKEFKEAFDNLPKEERYNFFMKAYEEAHHRCPKCKSVAHMSTLVGCIC